MARTVHGGTEALQSFFSAPAWIAWREEEKILPCFRIRQQGECVRITRRESRNTAFTVQRSSGISSGANQAPSPGLHESRITRHETRLFPVHRGCERVAPQKTAAQSLFSSSPLFTIVRYGSPLFGKKYCPAPVSLPRQPFPAGLTTSAVRRAVPVALRTASVEGNAWPACLTTRRGEVRERAVRTRRKPGGGKRREPLGARRRTRQYVEHGKQAQRSPGGRIVCFDRRVVRKAG